MLKIVEWEMEGMFESNQSKTTTIAHGGVTHLGEDDHSKGQSILYQEG